jgi:hypothetical protein
MVSAAVVLYLVKNVAKKTVNPATKDIHAPVPEMLTFMLKILMLYLLRHYHVLMVSKKMVLYAMIHAKRVLKASSQLAGKNVKEF